MTATRPATSLYTSDRYRPEHSVGYLMKRVLTSIVRHAEERFGSQEVTHVQWHSLYKLADAGKPLAVAELARELETDAGAMTRLLDRMERKRLCRRIRSTADRRVVMVELTPEGAAAAGRLPEVMSEVLNAHLAGFTAEELGALMRYLDRMRRNAEGASFTRMSASSDKARTSNAEDAP